VSDHIHVTLSSNYHHTCSPHTSTALPHSSHSLLRLQHQSGISIEHAEHAHGFHHRSSLRTSHVLHTLDGGFGSGQFKNADMHTTIFAHAYVYAYTHDFNSSFAHSWWRLRLRSIQECNMNDPLSSAHSWWRLRLRSIQECSMNVHLHTPDGGFGSGQLRNAACDLDFIQWHQPHRLQHHLVTSTSTQTYSWTWTLVLMVMRHTWLARNIMEQAFARNIQGIGLCKEYHEKINVSS
jgi:hypothetical protein